MKNTGIKNSGVRRNTAIFLLLLYIVLRLVTILAQEAVRTYRSAGFAPFHIPQRPPVAYLPIHGTHLLI